MDTTRLPLESGTQRLVVKPRPQVHRIAGLRDKVLKSFMASLVLKKTISSRHYTMV